MQGAQKAKGFKPLISSKTNAKLDKPARLIIRLLFGFVVKLNKSENKY